MTSHADKGISSIAYNFLNLPNRINQNTGNTTYLYRADGSKLRKTYGNTITDYLDGFQYTDGQLQFIPTSEGYYDFTKNAYIYNYVDHLGNIRLSYFKGTSGGAEIIDENNYYPFGLKHEGYNAIGLGSSNYQYKFGGKELQETGMYDFGARMYMPDIARTPQIDPLAETMPEWSSYSYSFNNPMRYTDPTGMLPQDWYRDNFGNVSWHDSQLDQLSGSNGETLTRLGASGSYINVNGELTTLNEDASVTQGGVTSYVVQPMQMSNASYNTAANISTPGSSTVLSSFDTTKKSAPRLPSPGLMDPSAAIFKAYLDIQTARAAFTGLRSILFYKSAATETVEGFSSFSAFKRAHGPAGEGMAWHHIVEQNPTNKAQFAPEALHNTNNVIKIEHGAGSLHSKVSGFYSSKPPFAQGQTVRQWLNGQSYQQQYDFGIKTLKQFGWKQ